jgi:hypothetical protein
MVSVVPKVAIRPMAKLKESLHLQIFNIQQYWGI